MNISGIQINQVFKGERPGTAEGMTGKVISRQDNTLEILVGDKVVKVEARGAGKIVPGDLVQVFFGEDTARAPRPGQERADPVTAKLLDIFSVTFPFPLDENTARIVEGFTDADKIGFSRIIGELNGMVNSLLQEVLTDKALETSENNRNAYFSVKTDELRASIVELALRAKNMGKAWQDLPQKIKEEIVKTVLVDPFVKKAQVELRAASVSANQSSQEGTAPLFAQSEEKPGEVASNRFFQAQSLTRDVPEIKPSLVAPTPLPQDLKPATGENNTFMKTSESAKKPLASLAAGEKESVFSRLRMPPPLLSSPFEENTRSRERASQNDSHPVPPLQTKVVPHFSAPVETVPGKPGLPPESPPAYGTKEAGEPAATTPESGRQVESKSAVPKAQGAFWIPLEGEDETVALMTRIVKALKEILAEPHQMRDFYDRKEKLVDNIPLRIPLVSGNSGSVISPRSETNPSEHSEPKTEEPKTSSKGYSQGSSAGIGYLSPLARKIVDLLTSETTVIGKEDRQLLETILKILRKPGVANEEAAIPVKTPVTPKEESQAAAQIWREMLSRPGLSALSDKIKPEVGARWVQVIGSLSREAGKSIYFGEQTFLKSFSAFFENQIRPEVHQAFPEATASFESTEKVLVSLKEALFSFGEGKRQIETLSKDLITTKGEAVSQTLSAIKEREGVSQSAVPKEGILSDTDKSQESLKKPAEGLFDRSASHRASLVETKESTIGREIPASDIKEGRPLSLKEANAFVKEANAFVKEANSFVKEANLFLHSFDRVLHIGNNPQYDMIYAGFVDLGSSVFHVDLFHNRKPSGGYAAEEIYRVIIEAKTERLGTVLVDTFSSNEQLDIVLYTEQRYGSYLTSHSHTLVRRLREDGFSVRLFQIKSLQEKDKVIAQKIKMISGTERGFSRFA